MIALHWLMLVLIAAAYACIELRVLYPKGSELREALKHWHFMLGLTIGALAVVRLVLRLNHPAPPIRPEPPAAQLRVAHAVQWTLYALLLAMPVAGWLILSAEGKPIPFWGLELPALTGADKALAKQVEEVHETVGKIGYALIALHAAAALFHHHVRRDDTLVRMLPGRG